MAPIKITYSERYIRDAIRSYWWHSVGSLYLFLLIPYTAFLFYQIATDNITWIIWVIGLGVLVFWTFMVILYIEYIKQSLFQLRSMNVPEATLELEEELARLTSDAGTTEIAWNSIREIWFSDKVWLLVASRSRHEFMTLPVAELTQEAKSFIISKSESVLYRTGQAWKIRAYYACSNLATMLVFGTWLIDPLSNQRAIFFYMTGLVFGVIAIILLFTIRCPKCRTNWNSQAAKRGSRARWPIWLLALQKCPFCGASGDDFKGEADEVSLD